MTINVINTSTGTLTIPDDGWRYSTSSSPYSIMNSSLTIAPQSQSTNGTALTVEGDANVAGDLKVKGRSILESLELIEKRIGILVPEPLQPDKELLTKYEELRELKRQYEEMEAQFKLLQILKD